MAVPKIIHYCWFGGAPLPDSAIRCIASWNEYCPGYEIKEWNESNFDIKVCPYVKQAYEAKKWAFVSDYARFWILYHYGGIYFDTDVEMVQKIDDRIMDSCFMGKEAASRKYHNMSIDLLVNTGLGLSANPHMDILKEIMEHYERTNFISEDGALNLTTVVERVSMVLMRYGYKGNHEIERIKGMTIYPPEYFCPLNPDTGKLKVTANTISVHHYSDSWHSNMERKAILLSRKFEDKGMYMYRIGRLVTLPIRIMAKIERLGIRGTLEFIKRR